MATCSVGQRLQTKCSAPPFVRRKSLAEREAHLLDVRTKGSTKLVCDRHYQRFISNFSRYEKYCCSPVGAHGASKVGKSMKTVNAALHDKCIARLPAVVEGRRMCISCNLEVQKRLKRGKPSLDSSRRSSGRRSALAALIQPASPAAPGFEVADRVEGIPAAPASDSGSSETSSGSVCSPSKAVVERANVGLKILGSSPLDQKNLLRSNTYLKTKYGKITSLLKTTLEKVAGQTVEKGTDMTNYEDAGKEMLTQLKDAFKTATTHAEMVRILSVLPSSWSILKIHAEFGAPVNMVRTMKSLVAEQGILCSPNKRRGRPLSKETENLVILFYQLPHISREMAGKKECLSVIENGVRTLKQKRLVLGDLREMYNLFKEENPEVKVGFSTFASLRPRNCVLAGSAGTHTVCVCMTHQNFKLMYIGANMGTLKINGNVLFSHYKDCFVKTMCSEPKEDCFFGNCAACPGISKLKEDLIQLFSQNFVESVTFKRWRKQENGRFSLEGASAATGEFVDFFLDAVPEIRQHDYVAKQQAVNYEQIKNSLEVGEVLVVADFSENFSFVIQDSIQGVYWNNDQATVHPFACYTRNPDNGQVEPLNLVVISDHLQHVTATVSAFQDALIKFLQKKVPCLKKIYYKSDGCTGQYKNRFNMKNLLLHAQDYNIPAEWHFFATSHGKGPSDGLGGTLKRMATKASLQRPYDRQIQTPLDLYEWAVENVQGLNCVFVSTQEVQKKSRKLAKRFLTATPLKGIRSHHAFIPLSTTAMEMKVLSLSTAGHVVGQLDEAVDPQEHDSDDPQPVHNAPSPRQLRPRLGMQLVSQPETPRVQPPVNAHSLLKRSRPHLSLTPAKATEDSPKWARSRLRHRHK